MRWYSMIKGSSVTVKCHLQLKIGTRSVCMEGSDWTAFGHIFSKVVNPLYRTKELALRQQFCSALLV